MKILFISYPRLDYSLNSVCMRGLTDNGVKVVEFHVKDRGVRGFIRTAAFYRQNSKNADAVIVGYDSPALVIFIRFFCFKKIIYNAVLSAYERLIISRNLASPFSVKAVYYWLLDFVAVHFANLTFVESNLQADYFRKTFKASRCKIYRSWIGVDDNKFFYDPAIKKRERFTVIFRGRLLPEAGAEYVVMAAKKLENEDIDFVMLASGQELKKIQAIIEELKPKNLKLVTDYLSDEELRNIMQSSHLSLGQLDDHERLDRTIPHKVYESLAMKLPYLTASNKGILELLKAGETCITCNPADAESLASKILWVKNNYMIAEKIAGNGYELYRKELKPHILAKNLLDKISAD